MTDAFDRRSPLAKETNALARRMVAALHTTETDHVDAVFASVAEEAVKSILGPLAPAETDRDRERRLTLLLAALCRITTALSDGVDRGVGRSNTLARTLEQLEAFDLTF